ncbi:hypothetical protein GII36_00190 [Candidatus Mycosynbacter amalyticus]|uniref:Membrane-anchored protein n=2 Tax=Candidatus Mycosynbacter amalyticus TaxID=2665156 RepID=A0A857MKZ7_9BACT|nr:hypothetical protein GII36_00190 [Candidatus Mycosynbacter amalyticus]
MYMAVEHHRTAHRVAWQTVTKVPQIAAIFWVVKLLTTALGEAAADYSVVVINPYIAVIGGFLLLLVALTLQFRAKEYRPATYWFAVAMVAVFGTMAADVLHIQFGVPYVVSTIFFAVSMLVMFGLWYKVEGTLSIHSIHTPRREAFYWLTIMATFALGTAAGDMTAMTLNLGYFDSILLFGVLIAIPAVAYWLFNANAILTFWCAYVLTRPLGASVADWLGKPHSIGGMGYGDSLVTLVLTTLLVIAVGYLAVSHGDSQRRIASKSH